MEKVLALVVILIPQPIIGFAIWFSMHQISVSLGLKGALLTALPLIMATVLYGIFCFFFARGFLGSKEAKKLGF